MARRVAQPPAVPSKRARTDTAALREKVVEADVAWNDKPGAHSFHYCDSNCIEFTDAVYAYAEQMLASDQNKKTFCRAVEELPGRWYRIGEGPGHLSDV